MAVQLACGLQHGSTQPFAIVLSNLRLSTLSHPLPPRLGVRQNLGALRQRIRFCINLRQDWRETSKTDQERAKRAVKALAAAQDRFGELSALDDQRRFRDRR